MVIIHPPDLVSCLLREIKEADVRSYRTDPVQLNSRLPLHLKKFRIFPIPFKILSLHYNALLRYSLWGEFTRKPLLSLLKTRHLKAYYHHQTHRFPSSLLHRLNTCENLRILKQTHASVLVSYGLELPSTILSKLASSYIQFNDFESSVSLLHWSQEPSTNLWNFVIKEHVESVPFESAFSVYKLMRQTGVLHDSYTLPILNRLSMLSRNRNKCGEMIHCVAFRTGFVSDVYFCNTIIDAYVKSGCFASAVQVFNEMPHRDLVSWTSMISGYFYKGNVSSATKLFGDMRKEVEPNAVTIIVMLQLCSTLAECKQLHGYVMKIGFFNDQSVHNSVLKVYVSTDGVDDAENLFREIDKRDVVSWNIMMSLYASRGGSTKMADCLNEMWAIVEPSVETLTLLISGFTEGGKLSQGQQIHCFALKSGHCDDILMTNLLYLYAKCGDLEIAAKLFAEVPHKDFITWSAMMTGFNENGYFKEAIILFQQMLAADIRPVAQSLTSLVIAYTHLGALQLGKSVHAYLLKDSFDSDKDGKSLETSILNLYIKCGSISLAKVLFDRLHEKDLITWTSMIEGFGMHGRGTEALELFHQMVDEGIVPESVTFLNLLSACSHTGLLYEGCEIFHSMRWQFHIQPDINHYSAIVDLLGRSGKIKEALAIILKHVVSPDSRIWGALFSAARIHEDHKFGEYAARRVLELEPGNAGYHTLLSNVQASFGNWDQVEDVRSSMKHRKLDKHPGWSCIETKGSILGFVSGDRSHRLSMMDEIYKTLMYLSRNSFDVGNVLYD